MTIYLVRQHGQDPDEAVAGAGEDGAVVYCQHAVHGLRMAGEAVRAVPPAAPAEDQDHSVLRAAQHLAAALADGQTAELGLLIVGATALVGEAIQVIVSLVRDAQVVGAQGGVTLMKE